MVSVLIQQWHLKALVKFSQQQLPTTNARKMARAIAKKLRLMAADAKKVEDKALEGEQSLPSEKTVENGVGDASSQSPDLIDLFR